MENKRHSSERYREEEMDTGWIMYTKIQLERKKSVLQFFSIVQYIEQKLTKLNKETHCSTMVTEDFTTLFSNKHLGRYQKEVLNSTIKRLNQRHIENTLPNDSKVPIYLKYI
jgi:hypothetical protein